MHSTIFWSICSPELPHMPICGLYMFQKLTDKVFTAKPKKFKRDYFNVQPIHGWASAELPRNRVNVNLFLRHIRDLSR